MKHDDFLLKNEDFIIYNRYAPLLPDGSVSHQSGSALDLAPPKTASGEALDHATVTSWRCKLRLKVGSLAAAYVIVDGVTVPAKEFLDTDIATAAWDGPLVHKHDEFCVENEEFCMKNDEFCMKK